MYSFSLVPILLPPFDLPTKLFSGCDILHYEWGAAGTIFPSSCYPVSFFAADPPTRFIFRERNRGPPSAWRGSVATPCQRFSDRSSSLNPSSRNRATRRRRVHLYGRSRGILSSDESKKNRLNYEWLFEAAHTYRCLCSNLSHIHGLRCFIASRHASSCSLNEDISEIVRSGRLSRAHRERIEILEPERMPRCSTRSNILLTLLPCVLVCSFASSATFLFI